MIKETITIAPDGMLAVVEGHPGPYHVRGVLLLPGEKPSDLETIEPVWRDAESMSYDLHEALYVAWTGAMRSCEEACAIKGIAPATGRVLVRNGMPRLKIAGRIYLNVESDWSQKGRRRVT